jgi:hypothetical protein
MRGFLRMCFLQRIRGKVHIVIPKVIPSYLCRLLVFQYTLGMLKLRFLLSAA